MSIPRRSPWLLKRLIAQPSSTPGTPSVQRKVTKRKIQLNLGLDGEQSKKINLDLIHNTHEALTQSDISDELNTVTKVESKFWWSLQRLCTTMSMSHEPAKYLKLVVTSSSSYYIQVDYPSYYHTNEMYIQEKFNTGFIQDHGRGKGADCWRSQRIMREIGRP